MSCHSGGRNSSDIEHLQRYKSPVIISLDILTHHPHYSSIAMIIQNETLESLFHLLFLLLNPSTGLRNGHR